MGQRKRDRVAFVLSGGGPLGALQVGALKALFGAGVRPDLVVGTSVGAVNASFVAFDPSPSGADMLGRIWRSLSDSELLPGSRLRTAWARMVVRGDHVFENHLMRDLITTRFPGARIEDARIPLGIVAADVEWGQEHVLSSGDLLDALLASTAMPGIFPPVRIGDRYYFDGGVADNVPIAPAIAMGATTVYAIDATAASTHQRRPLTRPIDYLLHAFALARAHRVRVERSVLTDKVRLVMVPMPTVDVYVPFASMRHTDYLIARAHEHVQTWLADPARIASASEAAS